MKQIIILFFLLTLSVNAEQFKLWQDTIVNKEKVTMIKATTVGIQPAITIFKEDEPITHLTYLDIKARDKELKELEKWLNKK